MLTSQTLTTLSRRHLLVLCVVTLSQKKNKQTSLYSVCICISPCQISHITVSLSVRHNNKECLLAVRLFSTTSHGNAPELKSTLASQGREASVTKPAFVLAQNLVFKMCVCFFLATVSSSSPHHKCVKETTKSLSIHANSKLAFSVLVLVFSPVCPEFSV